MWPLASIIGPWIDDRRSQTRARRSTATIVTKRTGSNKLETESEQFAPTDPSEDELMERFAKIGVGAGKTFDAGTLSPAMKKAIEDGVADAWHETG